MIHSCPICEKPIVQGETVEWPVEIDGQTVSFQVQCCKVDSFLCGVFPTLKKALSRSEVAAKMLRWCRGD